MKRFQILSPDEYISMPWRNGLGTTIELTKKEGTTAPGFYWRFSMADVRHDGPFSDFSGYDRQ
ncbi:MAG: HutD family protein [Pseudomonadota bacterium]